MLGVPDWRKPSNFAERCFGGEGPSDLFRVVSCCEYNLDDFEFDHRHHYHHQHHKGKKLRMKDKDAAEQLFTFLSTFLLQVYKYDDKQIVMMIIMITTMMTTMILMMAMMMMTL